MALKKADLERHRDEYYRLIAAANEQMDRGHVFDAIKCAVASWQYLDGMMRYENRFQGREFDNVECVEIVLGSAPYFLDFESLDALEDLLKTQRRIEKNTAHNLADKLAAARKVLSAAHTGWNLLANCDDLVESQFRRQIKIDDKSYDRLIGIWESNEVITITMTMTENTRRLRLTTRMRKRTCGKCPACGTVAHAPKAKFLDNVECPKCRESVVFVLLNRDVRA